MDYVHGSARGFPDARESQVSSVLLGTVIVVRC